MTDERWQQVRELFGEAMDLPPAERTQFLVTACAGDAELLNEINSLFTSHDQLGSFLDPVTLGNFWGDAGHDDSQAPIGKLIGSYRIVKLIAHGGMGEVYEAERDDGTFRKRVAVKLVRSGISHKEMVRRFEAERQLLATLVHPNIAQLIDAGTTDDGIPYLIMEFVDGKRIDEYCDEQKLSIIERLKLFRVVCTAVQFAHQNLVVHRDIKPSNILVTPEGIPKLLDFGIAKLLSEEGATEQMTQPGHYFMTTDYASPEQIRGENVTTVSDVYSLGVLLYKLLTGLKPYEFKSTLAYDISQTIIASEPTKPSSKEIQINTKEEGKKVRRILEGDLDNILLTALRKEPARRYKSVEQLSEDIRRYLEQAPVLASKDSRRYRSLKFVKRNRIAVIGVSLIVFSLLVGFATTLYQVRRARLEKAKAESINIFLKKMLNYSNPILMLHRNNAGETTMAEVLDEAAKRVESGEFDNQKDVKAELEKIIAESYDGLGKYDVSLKHFQVYVDLQNQLYGDNDPRTIEAKGVWAGILFMRGEGAKAEEVFRNVLPVERKQYMSGLINADVLAQSLHRFAYLRRSQGDSKEAEMLFRESLGLLPHVSDEQKYLVGVTLSTLASTIADQGRFEEAVQTAREAVTESQKKGLTDTPDYGYSLNVLGGFLSEQGNYAEADDTLQRAELIFRKLLKPSHLWLGDNLRNQALSLYQQDKFQDAMVKVTKALEIYIESFGKFYDHYPTALSLKGLILCKTGKAKEGETLLREAVKIRTETLPKGHFFTAIAQSALGECLTMQKRFAEAEPMLLESYESLKASQGPQNPRALVAQHRVSGLYKAWNKPELAAQYLK